MTVVGCQAKKKKSPVYEAFQHRIIYVFKLKLLTEGRSGKVSWFHSCLKGKRCSTRSSNVTGPRFGHCKRIFFLSFFFPCVWRLNWRASIAHEGTSALHRGRVIQYSTWLLTKRCATRSRTHAHVHSADSRNFTCNCHTSQANDSISN